MVSTRRRWLFLKRFLNVIMLLQLAHRSRYYQQRMRSHIERKVVSLLSDRDFSEVLTGSAWGLGAKLLATGLSMVTSIITARFYGAEPMGIVATVNAFLGLATTFTLMGTDTSVLRLIPQHMSKYSPGSAYKTYKKILVSVITVAFAVGAMLYFGSHYVAERLYGKPSLSFILRASSIFVVFLSLSSLSTQAVRGLKLIRSFALMVILPTSSRLLVLVALTCFWFHPMNPVWALYASIVITSIIGMIIIAQQFRHKISQSDKICETPLAEIAAISLPMLMTTAIGFVMGQTGILVLGIFRPVADVGHYDVAVKLATLTTFLLQAVNVIVAPKFAELYHGKRMADLFRVARLAARLIFWSTIPIVLGLLLLGRPVLALLYGAEFKSAYVPMVVLLIGQFVNAASGSTGYFMNMTGSEKAFRNIMFIAALLTITLCFVLVPHLGATGAALGTSLGYMTWNISCLLFIKRKHGGYIGYIPGL